MAKRNDLNSTNTDSNLRSGHLLAWLIASLFGAIWLAGAAIEFLPDERLFPGESVTLNTADFRPNGGHAFIVSFESELPSDSDGGSSIRVFEGDVELSSDSNHARIRAEGGGLFSHWGDSIYFSSTDQADPRANGRAYRVQFPPEVPAWGQWAGIVLLALGSLAMLGIAATGKLGIWGFATALPVVVSVFAVATLGGDSSEGSTDKGASDQIATEFEEGAEPNTLPAVAAGGSEPVEIEP